MKRGQLRSSYRQTHQICTT